MSNKKYAFDSLNMYYWKYISISFSAAFCISSKFIYFPGKFMNCKNMFYAMPGTVFSLIFYLTAKIFLFYNEPWEFREKKESAIKR